MEGWHAGTMGRSSGRALRLRSSKNAVAPLNAVALSQEGDMERAIALYLFALSSVLIFDCTPARINTPAAGTFPL
jgi:hypothetical protein